MDYHCLPKDCGVYMIYNFKLKKRYIGFSTNIFSRFQDGHLPYLHNNHHQVEALQDDWNNDSSCFVCTLLELTEDKSREDYWINYYLSNINGYNIQVGRSKTPEIRKKISVCKKGIPLSEEHKHHLSENHYNKQNGMPEIVKQKIREANTGKPKSEVHKKKAGLCSARSKLKKKLARITDENLRIEIITRLNSIEAQLRGV